MRFEQSLLVAQQFETIYFAFCTGRYHFSEQVGIFTLDCEPITKYFGKNEILKMSSSFSFSCPVELNRCQVMP